MQPYTIDDPICESAASSVDVTVDFGGGHKRWCFFVTPQTLASAGDFVEGTRVRMHLGERHMIVVGEITEGIIDAVLRQLSAEGELEARTVPLS